MLGTDDGIIIDGDERRNSVVGPDTNGSGDNKSRPAKPEIIGGFTVEGPDTERIADTGEPVKRGRGRPKGTRNAGRVTDTGEADTKLSSGITSLKIDELLLSIHLMGATFFKTPELALTPTESKELSTAIQKVGEFHQISFDPRKVAYFQLAVCAGGVYLPRMAKVWNRWKKDGTQPAPAARATPINQPRPPAQPPTRPISEMSPSDVFGSEGAAI